MAHEMQATCSAPMAAQCPACTPPSGRATKPTPTSPMNVPVQARAVQGWPFGRNPSRRRSHSGTVATISAAMPLGMRFSAHITSALPTDSRSVRGC